MAKKRTSKKKKPRPDAGKDAPVIPSLELRIKRRRQMDRVNRIMHQELDERNFETTEEMNAFVQEFFSGRTVDEILADYEPTPRDLALDLLDEAAGAGSLAKQLELSRRALEIDPDCIEAKIQTLLLEMAQQRPTEEEIISRLRQIIAEGERDLGEEFMREGKGHFWGLIETRPYMNACLVLVEMLENFGRVEEAAAECERMLELNPQDNQGVRDLLRGFYLQTGNLAGIRRINKDYPETHFAVCAWSSAIERFLSGDVKGAERRLRKAHKQNPHVLQYLTLSKKLPKQEPDHYMQGDENEAYICVRRLVPFFCERTDVLAWIGVTLMG